jgi:hypothetical protein
MPSATHVWSYGRNGTFLSRGTLTSKVIDVTGQATATVEFWYYLKPATSSAYVRGSVEVSFDGKVWKSVWTITGAATGAWTKIVTPSTAVPAGKTSLQVRFNVTAAIGKGCFTLDDICVSTVPIRMRTLTVTSDGCCAIDVTGDGQADVPAGQTRTFTYQEGTTASLTALLGPCCALTGWQVGGQAVAGNPIQVLMDGDKAATAVGTTVAQYTLTVTSNGCGSIDVTGDGLADVAAGATETFQIACGQQVTLRALAAEGCFFQGWTVNGKAVGGNPITFAMTEQKTAIAASGEGGAALFFDNMEGGKKGWTVSTTNWALVTTVCQPNMPSPITAWGFGKNGLFTGTGILTSAKIDVTGQTQVAVEFWYCLQLNVAKAYLNATVQVQLGTGAWRTIWTSTGAPRGAWTKVGPLTVNIPSKTTTLRLRVNVTGSKYAGCFTIDDVAVVDNGTARQAELGVVEPSAVEFRVDSVENVPNPIRDVNTTTFSVKGVGIEEICVNIYDQTGLMVFTSGWQPNDYDWHVESSDGETLANGVYLYSVVVRGITGEIVLTEVQKLAVYR